MEEVVRETLIGLNGNAFAYLAMAFSLFMTCIGSAKGVGMVGEAMSGVLIEDPNRFGSLMILQVIPGTNGIYGFLITFIILTNSGLMGGGVNLPLDTGILLFLSSLPIGIVGCISVFILSFGKIPVFVVFICFGSAHGVGKFSKPVCPVIFIF